jgi:hypothetical protein
MPTYPSYDNRVEVGTETAQALGRDIKLSNVKALELSPFLQIYNVLAL